MASDISTAGREEEQEQEQEQDQDSVLSDEELRKIWKPNPSEEDVIRIVSQCYGHEADRVKIVKELDSYDDKNYLLTINDSKHFLLKVHNGVESADFLREYEKHDRRYDECTRTTVIHLQNAIMSHLTQCGIPTSEPQHTKGQEPVSVHSLPVVSEEHCPRDLVVRLLSWIPGTTLSSLRVLPIECLADAGRFLGRVDASLDGLPRRTPTQSEGQPEGTDTSSDEKSSLDPAASRHHIWDGKNAADLRDFVRFISHEERRGLIVSVLDAFQHEILDSGVASQFRVGMLHADFNDANVLVDDKLRISGVIDFGDSVASWRILDLTVGMAYAALTVYGKRGRSIAAAAAFLRGFSTVYKLADLEMEHLHLLLTIRLACSATLGAYSYQQNPGNEYLLMHSEPAWKALELFWGYDPKRRAVVSAVLKRIFRQACSYNCEKSRDDDSTNAVIDCTDLSFPDPEFEDLLQSLR